MKKVLAILFFLLCPFFVLALDKVDINTASLQQLDELTGIGSVIAQRIIDARPFSSVGDLAKVKGIGEKTLQKIKEQGLACINCQTEISQTTQTMSTNQTIDSTTTTINTTQTPGMQSAEISTENSGGPVYLSGVLINEILPSPAGADETEEWFEIYNSNNFEVDLSGWKIKDIAGTITTFTILQNTKINANGFLVFKRPKTKIILNNEGDGLSLYTPDNKNIDTVSFTKAPLNQSYNRTPTSLPARADWYWSTTLTPGLTNTIQAENNATDLSKPENSVNNNIVKAGVANISQSTNINPWFLFLTALVITIISALIVLFVKLKLKPNT